MSAENTISQFSHLVVSDSLRSRELQHSRPPCPSPTPGVHENTIALSKWTFVGNITSLLFNMLSRFVIVFLPRSKCPLIWWLQSPAAVILELKNIKSLTVSFVSTSICHEMMGPDAVIFIFWMLSFIPGFSLSFFTFIKSHFSSSLCSAIRVVSSAYLRLSIFLLAVLIPACVSTIQAFHMMYSSYKLNKQGDNIQPWCTPFPILKQSVVPCKDLTATSWPSYRFLRTQVRESWNSFSEFSTVCCDHTVKGFSVVNEAKVDLSGILLLFLWFNECWQCDLWFLCLF